VSSDTTNGTDAGTLGLSTLTHQIQFLSMVLNEAEILLIKIVNLNNAI